MILSDEKAEKLKKLIETFQEIAGIASSYSPCIDAVGEHGGEDSDDPIERIHWLCYHADYSIDLDAQATQQVQGDAVLDAPAQVNSTVFGVGVKHSTVVAAAQRYYQHMQENPRPVDRSLIDALLSKAMPAPKQEPVGLRYTRDGALAECPCCGSLDVGGAHDRVYCYGCELTITKPRPLKNAIDAWNRRTGVEPAQAAAIPESLPSLPTQEVMKIAPMAGNFTGWEQECFAGGFRRCAEMLSALNIDLAKKAWANGYDEGHNQGIGCGHDLAPRCRHDGDKEVEFYTEEIQKILSSQPTPEMVRIANEDADK